jgi:hypothetical protein
VNDGNKEQVAQALMRYTYEHPGTLDLAFPGEGVPGEGDPAAKAEIDAVVTKAVSGQQPETPFPWLTPAGEERGPAHTAMPADGPGAIQAMATEGEPGELYLPVLPAGVDFLDFDLPPPRRMPDGRWGWPLSVINAVIDQMQRPGRAGPEILEKGGKQYVVIRLSSGGTLIIALRDPPLWREGQLKMTIALMLAVRDHVRVDRDGIFIVDRQNRFTDRTPVTVSRIRDLSLDAVVDAIRNAILAPSAFHAVLAPPGFTPGLFNADVDRRVRGEFNGFQGVRTRGQMIVFYGSQDSPDRVSLAVPKLGSSPGIPLSGSEELSLLLRYLSFDP